MARVLYRNENLKRLLETVFGSGEALGNLTLFILFATLLFGIMGMHLFGGNYVRECHTSSFAPSSLPHHHRLHFAVGSAVVAPVAFLRQSVCADGCPFACLFSVLFTKIAIDGTETFWGRLNGPAGYFRHHDFVHGNWSQFNHGHDHRRTYGYDVGELINKTLIPRRNFEDMPRAFLLAFQIITGDDWVNQMHGPQQQQLSMQPAPLCGTCGEADKDACAVATHWSWILHKQRPHGHLQHLGTATAFLHGLHLLQLHTAFAVHRGYPRKL